MKPSLPNQLTIFFFAVISALVTVRAVLAETAIEITSDTSNLIEEEISSDSVKVVANYKPLDFQRENYLERGNLQYRIFYNESEKINEAALTFNFGKISLQDLDNDGISEAIVKTFSGGAHCCTNVLIYNWKGDRFSKVDLGDFDGEGGDFKDLDGDGKFELVSADESFLYQFSSYAGSFPPSTILSFDRGELRDVTRQYPKILEQRAEQMYRAFLASKKDNLEINGILAGYVAQKALLGEFSQAWDFMLANYDRNSEWGLEIYSGDRQIGTYPNFPTALREFLMQHKYLN